MILVHAVGFDEMERRMAALASASPWLREEAGVAYRRGLRILEVAARLVPVDTGVLRGSGFVSLPKLERGHFEVTIGFGGPAASYAKIVHENLEAFHAVGQAKYLEEPFLAERDGMLDEFRKATVEFVREQMAGRRAA